MERLGNYDTSLQMFVNQPKEPDMGHLRFMRWLLEQNLGEHEVSGPPAGRLAVAQLVRENSPKAV